MRGPEDRFRTFDAAYVLGALSPEDRGAFEQHLKECAGCALAVQEVAGLPGLLSQVTPEMIDGEQVPADLLPSVVTRVRRARRRRTLIAAGISVASLAAAAVVVTAVLVPSSQTPAAGTAMTPLGPYPVQAMAAVEPMSGGSRVDMSCSYRGAAHGADYLLVAVRPDGSEAELATWYADPNRTAKVSIDTAMSPAQIHSLEIRTAGGLVVLRWIS